VTRGADHAKCFRIRAVYQGIFEALGNQKIPSKVAHLTRIADFVLIDRPTDRLSEQQVNHLNQFLAKKGIDRSASKRATVDFFSGLSHLPIKGPILEIGSGNHPVEISGRSTSKLDISSYEGVDFLSYSQLPFDFYELVFACFVFHQPVSIAQLFTVFDTMRSSGILVFNFNGRDLLALNRMRNKLTRCGFHYRSFSILKRSGSRETIFLCAKQRHQLKIFLPLLQPGVDRLAKEIRLIDRNVAFSAPKRRINSSLKRANAAI
jgi:hypothetical protein